MGHPILTKSTVDDTTIKMRESGELYVDPTAISTGSALSGTWSLSSSGLLTTVDTATATTYKLTIANGLLAPVEV
jgi:hypothetical protein